MSHMLRALRAGSLLVLLFTCTGCLYFTDRVNQIGSGSEHLSIIEVQQRGDERRALVRCTSTDSTKNLLGYRFAQLAPTPLHLAIRSPAQESDLSTVDTLEEAAVSATGAWRRLEMIEPSQLLGKSRYACVRVRGATLASIASFREYAPGSAVFESDTGWRIAYEHNTARPQRYVVVDAELTPGLIAIQEATLQPPMHRKPMTQAIADASISGWTRTPITYQLFVSDSKEGQIENGIFAPTAPIPALCIQAQMNVQAIGHRYFEGRRPTVRYLLYLGSVPLDIVTSPVQLIVSSINLTAFVNRFKQ